MQNIQDITLKKFAEDKLGITMWKKMKEIFDAVQSGERKILIRSCNGAGKTCALAAICNWKLATTSDSIVLTTASSHTQVKRNLWGEIRKQAKHAELFEPKQITETFIKITDKHYAIGISPSLPENAQGFHAEKMLIIVDEATGVSRDIMSALFGNATGKDAQIILAYNPLDTDSFAFEAEQGNDWHKIQISAMDHPNIVGEQISGADSQSASEESKASPGGQRVRPTDSVRPSIPGAVSPEWIADMLPTWSYEVEDETDSFAFGGKYWRKTAEVSARILGEWPRDSGEGFIPMHLVERSLKTPEERGTKAMGVDIARSGKDATVFAFFDGNTQLPLKILRTKDLVEIAYKIEQYYKDGWEIIALDDTGVGGGVTDILTSNGVKCYPVNFANAAKGFLENHRRDIANARAEMFFLLESELKKKEIKLANDRKLHQEISAIRLHHGSEKYLLENKDDLKKRLGRSPDRADATALARYALKLEERGRMPKLR